MNIDGKEGSLDLTLPDKPGRLSWMKITMLRGPSARTSIRLLLPGFSEMIK